MTKVRTLGELPVFLDGTGRVAPGVGKAALALNVSAIHDGGGVKRSRCARRAKERSDAACVAC